MIKYKIDEITINLDNQRKPLNSIERSKISEKKLYPYYGANNMMDYVDKYIFDEEILCVAEDGGSWGYKEKCSYIVNEKCWVNNHAHVLKAKDNLNLKYLNYYLNFNDLNSKITGTTRGKLTKSALNSIEVLLPNLKEQDKIVNVLDKAKELIEKRKVQIEALDELIKSVFYDIFGDPVDNPMKWEKYKLGNKCDIYRGGSPRPITEFLGGNIPWIKIGDATKGDNIYLNNTKEKIIEDGIKKSRLVRKGGIIFANCGVSLGFARIINFDGCIHDGWLSLENVSKEINKIFLLKLLNSYTEYFRKTAPDGTQPNLNTSIMKDFMIIIPPLEFQDKFAKIIENIEKQKEQLKESLTQLENNFNSLIQKAFKGELFN